METGGDVDKGRRRWRPEEMESGGDGGGAADGRAEGGRRSREGAGRGDERRVGRPRQVRSDGLRVNGRRYPLAEGMTQLSRLVSFL